MKATIFQGGSRPQIMIWAKLRDRESLDEKYATKDSLGELRAWKSIVVAEISAISKEGFPTQLVPSAPFLGHVLSP